MMTSIINLSGAGSYAKEQVEPDDPYSSVETPIADLESVGSSEERVSLPVRTNNNHQKTTLVDEQIDHQRDSATLQSTTLVDIPVEVLPPPPGTRRRNITCHLLLAVAQKLLDNQILLRKD